MTEQGGGIWIQSIERWHKVSFFKKKSSYAVTKFDKYIFSVHSLWSLFFLKVTTKSSWKDLAKYIKFWVGHSHQLWDFK